VFLYPTPELPDDTPIDHVRFAVRIRKVLNAAGIKLAPSSSTRADSESGPLLSLRATEIFAFKRRCAKAWAAFAAPMIHDLSVF
jgi:hypothetical protein